MSQFGKSSLEHLAKLHPQLRAVLLSAIEEFDFSVIQTTRTREEQEADFAKGTSHAHYGQSPHDFEPALAADCAPYPIDWNDKNRFCEMANVITQHAAKLGIAITWGGIWNMQDDGINPDMPHFQLKNWRKIAQLQLLS